MNTHELRTRTKKSEIQPDIVVRKAEKKLRKTENSQFELRLFLVYQPLTSISQQKLKFLRQPSDTTIVDSSLVWFVASPAQTQMEFDTRTSSFVDWACPARTRFSALQISICNAQQLDRAAFSRYLQITKTTTYNSFQHSEESGHIRWDLHYIDLRCVYRPLSKIIGFQISLCFGASFNLRPLPGTNSNRQQTWARLTESPLDLLVLGGGIVGSGVARDAALRGLRVALVEQYDFASGTSSRSSRLLHGGLRYLEQGRIGLVREASREKKILHRIAPHLAQPLGFIFPTYHGKGRPFWQLRVGVKIYDLLCGGENFEPSRAYSRDQTQALLPELKSKNLTGAVRYFDALTNDARLVIDTLRSAEMHGAILLNYARFRDANREGKFWRCQIEDSTGVHALQAKAIVNATGPWADKVPHSAVKLRLTKGIHMVVPHTKLPVPSAVVITEGKRILFVLPWSERVIIGTTDTQYSGAPENVSVEPEDIRYLLAIVNEFCPRISLSDSDILSSWAGVRPLIAKEQQSYDAPSDISRAHQIRSPEPGWWDVAGGKLTTYRLMAEQALDGIIRYLDLRPKPCRTADEPLLQPNQIRFSGIQPPSRAREAVEHYVQNEWALHLEDVLLRRSGWFQYDQLSPETIETVADWMALPCSWSPQERRAEITTFFSRIQNQKTECREPAQPNVHL